jgi:hypothetical protein
MIFDVGGIIPKVETLPEKLLLNWGNKEEGRTGGGWTISVP